MSGDIIPISNLTIIPGDVVAERGSLDGVEKGPAHTFTDTSDQAILMKANKGFGRGIFRQDEAVNLFINVYSAQGNYNATVTITIF